MITDDLMKETKLLCYCEGLSIFKEDKSLFVHYTEADPSVYLLPGKLFIGSVELKEGLKTLQRRLSIISKLMPVSFPSGEELREAREEMADRQSIPNNMIVLDDI